MSEEKTPKVSVCVVTYNQEKYIRQCLQSIVEQETDFDFEVIVVDDCSTDRTREIIKEISDQYAIIKPIFHESNIGAFKNYKYAHSMAVGEYIAHLDGDDFFYPTKLLKQVEHLNRYPDCALVAHRMSIRHKEEEISVTKANPDVITLPHLLLRHPLFLNSSIMYRASSLKHIFSTEIDFIDFYVYVNAALGSNIGFINEVLGAYRRNIGISTSRDLMTYIQAAINVADGFVSKTTLDHARAKQFLSYSLSALLNKDIFRFTGYITSAKKHNETSIIINTIFKLKSFPIILRPLLLIYKNFNLICFRIKGF